MHPPSMPLTVRVIVLIAVGWIGLAGLSGLFARPTRPYRIVCIGDDWVASGVPYYLWTLFQSQAYPTRILNEGRTGHRAYDVLQYVKNAYDRLAAFHPDAVILMVGTHDVVHGSYRKVQFFVAVQQLIRLVRTWVNPEGQPVVVLVSGIPAEADAQGRRTPGSYQRHIRGEINPLLRDIAAREHARWIAPPAVQGSLRERPHTHVTKRILAAAWYQALMPFTGLWVNPLRHRTTWTPSPNAVVD